MFFYFFFFSCCIFVKDWVIRIDREDKLFLDIIIGRGG
jgi:hypothetical protein